MNGKNLSRDESRIVMNEIMEGRATDAQISAYLVALRMKGETTDEIAGSAEALKKNTSQITLNQEKIVDISGTGGDNLNTFNISTSAAITAAGAGIKVAKHGKRSITTKCGSADILKLLGVKIDLGETAINKCLAEIGLAFIFAPKFQSTWPYVVGPRREIGSRTILNLLSTMIQPVRIKRQVIGVYDQTLMAKVIDALRELGAEHVMAVHGEDGLDEITISGKTKVLELIENDIYEYEIKPEDFGLSTAPLSAIQTESCEENEKIIENVLNNIPGPALNIVLLNAAALIKVGGMVESISEGIEKAKKSIETGAAREILNKLIKMTNSF
ncbi:MAG: anthranilate phosphoribosyltransferase [Calditrichaceae bacterium]|nr:anthranilate phosphoribosyltransferase [Calditrichaceae bacterium]MBN2708816.1 anthranilate phosphoribosyltransferase [Calditrichaceae bacterium]RQV97655.1 MAG: anthranilate phosphoribosyltransferase [Calditrichota bacterium]